MIPLIALEVLGQAWLVLFGVVIILGLALLFGMSPINTRPADTRKSKKHDGTVTDANIIASLKSELNWVNSRIDKKDQLIEELKMSLRRGNLNADKYLELKPRIVVAQIALRQVREYLQSIGSLSQEQASLLNSVKQSLNFINEDRPDMATIKKAITAENVAREFRQAYGSAKESFTPVNWIEEANKIDPSTQQKLYYGIDLSEGEAAKVQRLYSGTWLNSDAPHDLTGSDPIFEKDAEEAGKAAKLNFEPFVDFQKILPIKGDSPTKRWTSGGNSAQNLPKSIKLDIESATLSDKEDRVKSWWEDLTSEYQLRLIEIYRLVPVRTSPFTTYSIRDVERVYDSEHSPTALEIGIPEDAHMHWWSRLSESERTDLKIRRPYEYGWPAKGSMSAKSKFVLGRYKEYLDGCKPGSYEKCPDPDCSVCYADRNASSPEAEDQKAKERPSWETPDGTQYGIDLAGDPEEKTKVTRKKRIKYYDEALKWWNGLDEPTRIELRSEYDIPAMLTPGELDLVDMWHDES